MKLQCLIAIFLLSLIELFSFFDLFLYDRIYDSDSRQVQDVTRRTFHVGEVDRFVQTHLDRADRFADAECVEQLVSTVGRTQVREDQRVDIFAFQLVERIHVVTQFLVQSEVDLHFSIYHHVRIVLVQIVDRVVDLQRAALLVGTEVGVGQHRHNRFVREEFHSILSQAGDIDQYFCRRMAVDQRVGNKERTFLASQDIQSTEMCVRRTDTNCLLYTSPSPRD